MVRHGYGLRAQPFEQRVEPLVPQGAAGHLHALSGDGAAAIDIEIVHIQVNAETVAEVAAQAHVAVRLFAPQVVVAVRGYAGVAGFDEGAQESHRVGAAAQSRNHRAGAVGEETVAGDG